MTALLTYPHLMEFVVSRADHDVLKRAPPRAETLLSMLDQGLTPGRTQKQVSELALDTALMLMEGASPEWHDLVELVCRVMAETDLNFLAREEAGRAADSLRAMTGLSGPALEQQQRDLAVMRVITSGGALSTARARAGVARELDS